MGSAGITIAAIAVRAAAAAQVFVDDPGRPALSDEDAHHLGRVLRLRDGEEVIAADGLGRWARTVWRGAAQLEPIATGVVLGAATGLSALFLYLITLSTSTTGSTQSILFGSVFSVEPSTLPDAAVLGLLVLAGLTFIRRPLLMSSISPELAGARGIRVRWVGLGFMVMLAVAVGLSAIVIGSILSTALLIGPPASTLKVASRLSRAVALAGVLGVFATWLGVILAYDSYYWFASRRGLPVSFFVVVLVMLEFVIASAYTRWRRVHVATLRRAPREEDGRS